MTDIKQKYSSSVGLTITLASLANNSGRASNAVDNTTDNFISADIGVKVKTGSGTSANSYAEVYLLRSEDGTNYDDNYNGSDSAFTAKNAILLGTMTLDANTTTFTKTFDTQQVGITLPKKWSVGIVNKSGGTWSSTGADHEIKYTGKYYQSN